MGNILSGKYLREMLISQDEILIKGIVIKGMFFLFFNISSKRLNIFDKGFAMSILEMMSFRFLYNWRFKISIAAN